MTGLKFLTVTRIFLFTAMSRLAVGHPDSYPMGTVDLSSEVK
jgi:hypothetical protein